MRSYSILLVSTLLGCAASAPDGADINEYKAYISELDENVRLADEESFADGERENPIALMTEINDALKSVENFEELDLEKQESLLMLHNSLHGQIVGFEGRRSTERICRTQSSVTSHIGNRTCRTRDQLTRERISAREFLRGRSDAIHNVFLDERNRETDPIYDHQRNWSWKRDQKDQVQLPCPQDSLAQWHSI